MRNIFLEKSDTKCGGETVPRPFKIQIWAYLWTNNLKFYAVSFYCMTSWRLLKYVETKLQTACFTSYTVLTKTERSLKLVSLSHFLHDFWKMLILLQSAISEILSNMCIVVLQLFVNQVVTSEILKLTLTF